MSDAREPEPASGSLSEEASAVSSPNTDTASAKETLAVKCDSPPVDVAEVTHELDIINGRETSGNVSTAPEAQQKQGSDAAAESGSARPTLQGYGTFGESVPGRSENICSTSETENEEAMLLPSNASNNQDLSNWMVFTNLTKASMGTGILAMPMAIRNAGLIGLPLFAAIAVVCVYCIHLLVRSSRTLRRRLMVPALEYADTAAAACKTSRSPVVRSIAPFARGFTEVVLLVYMIGVCSVYVLFVKENLKQLIDVSCRENEWSSIDYFLHLGLVLMVLVAIPNLSSLSIVSSIANITMVVGVVMCLAIICYQIYVDQQAAPVEYNRKMDTWSNVTIYNVTVEAWAGWDRIPLFFGTAVFALEGIGVVLTLENQMKDPTNFLKGCGVLNFAMAIIAILYILMGSLGYLAYGEKTKGSITLNLPPDNTLALWVRKTVTLAIFLTYPLQFYVPEEILWKWMNVIMQSCFRVVLPQRLTHWAGRREEVGQAPRFLFKVLLMLATVCLPLIVPRLGPAISLVGAVCLSMLGLILPTIIHAITYCEEISQNIREPAVWSLMAFHVIIVIIGLLGLITGTYVSLNELSQEPVSLNAVIE
ncbi:proton-coupled amino acid transporter 2-like [Schistocerca cancellata]|uniref:proton-coupled amino acid transporter 2-like n=1 Tax=Schistocerca cancellata TaxID=274614 RepID=UPI002118CF1B|nr:proton-coupled amino acid transporter 2-like [Schistocerca cancellata]